MIFYEMYDCKRNSFFVKKQNQKNQLKNSIIKKILEIPAITSEEKMCEE